MNSSLVAPRWALAPLAALSLVVASLTGASAQAPGRPITFVVPYTPGSGPDIMARVIGEELQKMWDQPVVVDNKPGASGNIGAQFVARATPDGNTIMMTTNPFTANISLLKNVPYDPVTSFTPIIEVGVGALALAIHPSLPVNSTAEFIAYVKAHPGEVNYGSPGVGTPHHLAMELFKLTAGVQMTHVPYRGSAGATSDLLGGHVQAGFQAIHVILPMAKAGQVKLLGLASKERVKVAPDLPTLQEEGLKDFEVDLWYGILAPAGTPGEAVTHYNTAINEILRRPDIVEKLGKQGLTVVGGSPRQLADFIAKDMTKWQGVVKGAGISAE